MCMCWPPWNCEAWLEWGVFCGCVCDHAHFAVRRWSDRQSRYPLTQTLPDLVVQASESHWESCMRGSYSTDAENESSLSYCANVKKVIVEFNYSSSGIPFRSWDPFIELSGGGGWGWGGEKPSQPMAPFPQGRLSESLVNQPLSEFPLCYFTATTVTGSGEGGAAKKKKKDSKETKKVKGEVRERNSWWLLLNWSYWLESGEQLGACWWSVAGWMKVTAMDKHHTSACVFSCPLWDDATSTRSFPEPDQKKKKGPSNIIIAISFISTSFML